MTVLIVCAVLSLALVLDAVLNVHPKPRRTLSQPRGDATAKRARLRLIGGGLSR